MTKAPLSVTIITLNEESNIKRAINSVNWADEIIVVDSGSQDQTCTIASQLGAKVVKNNWPGFGQQKNYAHDLAKNDWILNIDADEEVTDSLAKEIQNFLHHPDDKVHGFYLKRKTFYLNRWIMYGGWYPNKLVRMSRKNASRWTTPEVHEELKVNGNLKTFENPLQHFGFKNIKDQVQKNLTYSHYGHVELKKKNVKKNIFKLILKPFGKFFETYIFKLGFLDGVPGLIISLNAAHSIFLKYAYFYEEKK